MKAIKTLSYCCLFIFGLTQLITADEIDNPDCIAVHNNGKLIATPSYTGGGGSTLELRDCYTNQIPLRNAEFPKGSGLYYIYQAIAWYGGIVENDTLVSQTLIGELSSNGNMILRSISDPTSSYYENAVSELDYVFFVADTFMNSPFLDSYLGNDIRHHKPLGITVKHSSYSWSFEYAEDFILLEIEIKNVSNKPIEDFYYSMKILPMAGYMGSALERPTDDMGGFLKEFEIEGNCPRTETFNMVWGADNDGNPVNGEFNDKLNYVNGDIVKSCISVGGFLFLNDKNSSQLSNKKISYNWWFDEWDNISDLNFGPVKKVNSRDLGKPGTGSPFGDAARYFLMSNGEVDYDQIFTSQITSYNPTWLYPDQSYASNISDGIGGAEHMLSIGPFDIPPGGVLKIPFAYVAGENFHTIPTNGENLPDFPKQYYRNLDFTDIVTNAQWARWIYDNPGVDTDGDGDSGLYQTCVLDSQLVDGEWQALATDTFWYRGDGVPDWRAAGPPPAPYVWLDATHNGIHVRFNGSRSETEKDIFTRIADFEGYNIYFGRDERETSLSLVASYDKDNFDKFVYDFSVKRYIVQDIPLTLEQIRCAYADSCNDVIFDPLIYSRTEPLFWGDSLIFFEKHAFNVDESSITKVFPNARDPRLVPPDSLLDSDYTEDGYFKFFEYEYTIENLLPTVSYWVNVTAFDFGSPKSGLKALETSKVLGIQEAYPLAHADDLSGERKQVYIYPNPYRIDAGYRKLGYEGRTEEDRPDYRVRELNFANLPPKCEIKIFSLDGDLIRHLSHDMPAGEPTSSHEQWNLITRNTQMIVSGLYYWTVEFPDGEVQMGKFVAIM